MIFCGLGGAFKTNARARQELDLIAATDKAAAAAARETAAADALSAARAELADTQRALAASREQLAAASSQIESAQRVASEVHVGCGQSQAQQ